MEKRAFGKTDMTVSVLGFGGAEIGFQGATQDTVIQLLHSALDAGLNVIDTAECYSNSEELIGKAVCDRRQTYYLFTKCGHGESYVEDRWRAADLRASIDRSLKRLKTDYVDLLQLHSCSENILKQGEVIETLQEIKKAGKTRYIGYSGDGQAALYAINTGAFDSLQTSCSIADQQSIDLTIPEAAKRGMGVIAKRPVANAAWRYTENDIDAYARPYLDRLKQLKYDFLNGDATRAIATALRFTLSVPGVDTAIVGTTKPGRWRDNARLLEEGKLPGQQYEAIRARWQEVSGGLWGGEV